MVDTSVSDQERLIEALIPFSKDPYGFVLFAYPWGEVGGELADRDGPNTFQTSVLRAIADGLLTPNEAIRIAVASGHGIGKTALISWIIDWSMSTFPDTRGVVTASTETQLRTRTWVELSKWHRLSLTRSLFELSASALCSKDPMHRKEWRFDAIPWSDNNPQAFAGLHNLGKRLVLLFDEGSAINDAIWEVADGALTDQNTEIIWSVFGNPEKAIGRFRECFEGGRFSHRWHSWHVDSRTVPHTNEKLFEAWVNDWGEDSDFVRVRVRGMFPRHDLSSFISAEVAREASERVVDGLGPMMIGVDPARYGRDPGVIYFRRGLDGRSVPPEIYLETSTMELAYRVELAWRAHPGAQVYVDCGGVGGGVVDRLIQRRVPVFPIDFGSKADNSAVEDDPGVVYYNKRAEVWGAMRHWLQRGSIVDHIPALGVSFVEELASVQGAVNDRDMVQLESKKRLKQRGLRSPNIADALAATFAYPDYSDPYAITDELVAAQLDAPRLYDDYDPFEAWR